jgi:hypothetical protein
MSGEIKNFLEPTIPRATHTSIVSISFRHENPKKIPKSFGTVFYLTRIPKICDSTFPKERFKITPDTAHHEMLQIIFQAQQIIAFWVIFSSTKFLDEF